MLKYYLSRVKYYKGKIHITMAENKAKNTVEMKEALNDSTMSANDIENVEKRVQDISIENKTEVNSCKKDIEATAVGNKDDRDEGANSEDSERTESMAAEVEKDSEASSKTEEGSNVSVKEINNKTEKSKQTDNSSVKTKDTHSASKDVSEDEATLNKISKVVHEDLSLNSVHWSPKESKESGNEDDSSVEEIKMKDEPRKESVPEVVSVETNVPVEVETVKPRRDSESKLSVEIVEHMEVGIVGPPTTVSELINEEELKAESALSTDQKVQDHVAEWVQNSAKAEELAAEEETPVNDGQHEKEIVREKRARKKKNNDALALPTRKSQRIVSNIIKKSIKW